MLKIVIFLARQLMRVIFRIKVIGRENIPTNRGFVMCPNHINLFDPVHLVCFSGVHLSIMGKAELFKNPFFARLFRFAGAFPVERGKNDTGAIEKSAEAVNSGRGLLIFPEGHRSKTGELQRFKSGAAVIAAKTGADVLPVAIRAKLPMKFRSRVEVVFLPVIKNSELGFNEEDLRSVKRATGLIRDAVQNGLESN